MPGWFDGWPGSGTLLKPARKHLPFWLGSKSEITMVSNRVVEMVRYERGIFGKIFKFLFVAFNIVMLIWLLSSFSHLFQSFNEHPDEASRTGATAGFLAVAMFQLIMWIAGAVILWLLMSLTRGKKIIERTTAD